MISFIHHLSSFLFYILGTSFFVAYLLMRNALAEEWPRWWLEIADLPLSLIAILYGGLSIFLSIHGGKKDSKSLIFVIAIPLIALFVFLVILNFWQ
jgi:hypothetical protein